MICSTTAMFKIRMIGKLKSLDLEYYSEIYIFQIEKHLFLMVSYFATYKRCLCLYRDMTPIFDTYIVASEPGFVNTGPHNYKCLEFLCQIFIWKIPHLKRADVHIVVTKAKLLWVFKYLYFTILYQKLYGSANYLCLITIPYKFWILSIITFSQLFLQSVHFSNYCFLSICCYKWINRQFGTVTI